MPEVYLTRRALLDLDEIDTYPTQQWGEQVAERYLADLRSAMDRFGHFPSLLVQRPEFSGRLRFYRAREHLLICDVIEEAVYVLAIRHGSMDLPERIAELEPQLLHEAKILHDRITSSS